MTTDLWMLTWTAVLSFVFPFIYQPGRWMVPGGVAWAFSNRDQPIEPSPWVGRAVRTQQNYVENIAPFAILVLVAHVAGKSNDLTALGATVFFWARVAYSVVYVAGIIYVRTVFWFVAWFGELLILSQLLR